MTELFYSMQTNYLLRKKFTYIIIVKKRHDKANTKIIIMLSKQM